MQNDIATAAEENDRAALIAHGLLDDFGMWTDTALVEELAAEVVRLRAEAQQIRLVSLADDVVIGEDDLEQLREIAAREGYSDAGGLLTYLLFVEKHNDALGQSVCGMIAARPTPERVAARLPAALAFVSRGRTDLDMMTEDEILAAVREAMENPDGA